MSGPRISPPSSPSLFDPPPFVDKVSRYLPGGCGCSVLIAVRINSTPTIAVEAVEFCPRHLAAPSHLGGKIRAAPHCGVETSRESASKLTFDRLGNIAKRIVGTLRTRGPLTDSEIVEALGIIHETASSVRRSLVLCGVVVDSGERRVPPFKRNRSIVWKLTGRALPTL